MENYTSFYGKGPKSFYNKGNSYGGLIETIQDVTIGPLDIASFNTNIKKPLKKLLVDIEPAQAGSGDPSLDNVRPISGWTGANIYVSPTNDLADGRTYSVTFPTEAGIVYGGILDLINGTLAATMAKIDLGTLTWKRVATKVDGCYRFQSSDLPGPAKAYPSSTLSKCKCEIYKTVTSDEVYTANDGIYITSSGKAMVYDSRYPNTTASVFSTAVSGFYLVYELTEPIIYQFVPVNITTLLGNNNIWVNTGDIQELTYSIRK